MTITERDLKWDAKIIVVRESGVDSVWDGRVKNLVYNSSTMEWEAETPSGGGGGGGGAVQITDGTQNATITDVSGKKSLDVNVTDINIDQELSTKEVVFKKIVDEASATVTYLGTAQPGTLTSSAAWQIQKITTSGSELLIALANGSNAFNQIWDNRASLSYS